MNGNGLENPYEKIAYYNLTCHGEIIRCCYGTVTVQKLLDNGDGDTEQLFEIFPNFDPNGVDEDARYWRVLMHTACRESNTSAMKTLLACGAIVYFFCHGLLRIACYRDCNSSGKKVSKEEHIEFVSTLLTLSTSVREHLRFDFGVLFGAVLQKDSALVRLLLHHGAPIQVKEGNLALLEHARTVGTCEIVELIEVTLRSRWASAMLLQRGEWRPHSHYRFPKCFRVACQTMAVLAKAHKTREKNARFFESTYPQACLDLLPEELLQFVFAYITTEVVPDVWARDGMEEEEEEEEEAGEQ